MKHALSLLIVIIACSQFSFGQREDTVKLKKTSEERKRMIVTDRPPQAAYFMLGGDGLIFSAHYDRRFQRKPGGPGFSGGIGFWFGDGATIFTFPVSLNYLVGKRNNFFELGAGPTLVTGAFDLNDSRETGSGVFWHINAGFRYQPAAGGFSFRAGFSPLFVGGLGIMWYYIGGGISF